MGYSAMSEAELNVEMENAIARTHSNNLKLRSAVANSLGVIRLILKVRCD